MEATKAFLIYKIKLERANAKDQLSIDNKQIKPYEYTYIYY